jgi:hypothetical protein
MHIIDYATLLLRIHWLDGEGSPSITSVIRVDIVGAVTNRNSHATFELVHYAIMKILRHYLCTTTLELERETLLIGYALRVQKKPNATSTPTELLQTKFYL